MAKNCGDGFQKSSETERNLKALKRLRIGHKNSNHAGIVKISWSA